MRNRISIISIVLLGVFSITSPAGAITWSISDQGLADGTFIPFVGTAGGTSARFSNYGQNVYGQRVGTVGFLGLPGGRVESHAAVIGSDGSVLDLGVLGGEIPPQLMGERFSNAYDINDAGQVIGQSSTNFYGLPSYSAFIWENGEIKDLGRMEGVDPYYNYNAMGINNSGRVVGFASYDGPRGGSNYSAAFLWDNGSFINLTESIFGDNWAMEFAFDINDAGQIIGTALMDDGYHTIIATPVIANPEPSTLLLVIAGLLGVAVCGRRLRKSEGV